VNERTEPRRLEPEDCTEPSANRPLLRCELAPADALPAPGEDQTLLTVVYGGGSPRTLGPRLDVANHVLGGGPIVERWLSPRPARAFRRGPLAWAEDGELLAGVLTRPSSGNLEELSRAHFAALLDLAAERGYPHLVRVWNYLPAINEGDGDLERYRRFNAGRARAFEERFGAATAESLFCASSAVGTPGARLGTAFLATRAPALHLENRRQVPAARYPRRYGPRAPSFSRATLVDADAGVALFVSGTASIVGHETVHPDSLEHQIDETLRNLDTVIEEARRLADWRIPALDGFAQVKVYLRLAGQAEAARARLTGRLPAAPATVFLEADICRSDLLVEIDGLALP
jgi:chorismate lyase/3-hydroxybenzoate synthase